MNDCSTCSLSFSDTSLCQNHMFDQISKGWASTFHGLRSCLVLAGFARSCLALSPLRRETFFVARCPVMPWRKKATEIKPRAPTTPGGGGGGDSHIKRAGMLVISLRGYNPAFWYHLGYSKQNTYIYIQHSTFLGVPRSIE